MSEEKITNIIQSCLEIDKLAYKIYSQFSSIFIESDMKNFWFKLAEDEFSHISFWKRLVELSNEAMIPQIFENPKEIINDLESIKFSVAKLEDNINEKISVNDAFLIAFRVEFHLLHRAFEILFHFSRDIEDLLGMKAPEEEYKDHINTFIDGLKIYGTVTPEMELLGESLIRLWHENKRLVTQIYNDPLTGVFNRRGFMQSITPIMYFSNRNNFLVGVLMIDIDNFKYINDKFGHQFGDEVLKQVASTIKSSIRKSDLCARYGGEEFIVFVANIEKGALQDIGNKILHAVEKLSTSEIRVTVSIGGYVEKLKENVEEDIIRFIKESDNNLYKAKHSGKNKMICN